MKNFFSALGFEPSLSIDPGAIESAWRDRTRKLGGSSPERSSRSHGEDAADLNEARAVLSDPARRLAHRLEIEGVSPGRAAAMEPEMMDLFSALSETLSRTDRFLGRHRSAESKLAKALLTKDAIAVQLELQDRMQTVQETKQEVVARFPELDVRAKRGDFHEASMLLGRLRFLSKWEAQCQERLLALLDC